MRRVQVAFVLLAVGLAVVMGFLIQRALGGVQIEREAQDRAVAERLFDEMERALSDFLRNEDGRPPGQYAFYYTPEGAPAQVRVVSPLASLPDLPYVVGYFQVDAEGRRTTPLLPEDRVEAAARGDFRTSLEREGRATRVLELAAALDVRAPLAERFPSLGLGQAPGTTRRVGGDSRLAARAPETPAAEPPYGAFEVLQSLNRGASERAGREQKTSAAPSPYPGSDAPVEEILADAIAEEDDVEPAEGRVAATAAPADGFERLENLPGARERMASLGLRIAVDPFHGRVGPDGLFLLTRNVRVGAEALRQGIVIDARAMLEFLRLNVLGESAEDSALRLSLAEEGTRVRDARYRHRFGEPFDALTVDLALAPLGDVAGAGAVAVLSALSVLVLGLALVALYRMVAVTVRFAERRSNFVAAVSHELKTPLTAIRMYGEMLRDGLVPDEEKRGEYYRSITAESERLSRLINNVLEFSRLERGSRSLEVTAGDVAATVREGYELLASHAKRNGQRLDLHIDDDLPAVRFERDALLQVLFNLVDNALKYARGARSPVIELHCRRSGERVELSVRDHGPGVATEHGQRILEPFYRGEDELVRKTQGTGIGLALVKGLVEDMGGRLAVGNAEGGGFRATVSFAAA